MARDPIRSIIAIGGLSSLQENQNAADLAYNAAEREESHRNHRMEQNKNTKKNMHQKLLETDTQIEDLKYQLSMAHRNKKTLLRKLKNLNAEYDLEKRKVNVSKQKAAVGKVFFMIDVKVAEKHADPTRRGELPYGHFEMEDLSRLRDHLKVTDFQSAMDKPSRFHCSLYHALEFFGYAYSPAFRQLMGPYSSIETGKNLLGEGYARRTCAYLGIVVPPPEPQHVVNAAKGPSTLKKNKNRKPKKKRRPFKEAVAKAARAIGLPVDDRKPPPKTSDGTAGP
jgi:hypothetical protein